jgi:hypothetical protein
MGYSFYLTDKYDFNRDEYLNALKKSDERCDPYGNFEKFLRKKKRKDWVDISVPTFSLGTNKIAYEDGEDIPLTMYPTVDLSYNSSLWFSYANVHPKWDLSGLTGKQSLDLLENGIHKLRRLDDIYTVYMYYIKNGYRYKQLYDKLWTKIKNPKAKDLMEKNICIHLRNIILQYKLMRRPIYYDSYCFKYLESLFDKTDMFYIYNEIRREWLELHGIDWQFLKDIEINFHSSFIKIETVYETLKNHEYLQQFILENIYKRYPPMIKKSFKQDKFKKIEEKFKLSEFEKKYIIQEISNAMTGKRVWSGTLKACINYLETFEIWAMHNPKVTWMANCF